MQNSLTQSEGTLCILGMQKVFRKICFEPLFYFLFSIFIFGCKTAYEKMSNMVVYAESMVKKIPNLNFTFFLFKIKELE